MAGLLIVGGQRLVGLRQLFPRRLERRAEAGPATRAGGGGRRQRRRPGRFFGRRLDLVEDLLVADLLDRLRRLVLDDVGEIHVLGTLVGVSVGARVGRGRLFIASASPSARGDDSRTPVSASSASSSTAASPSSPRRRHELAGLVGDLGRVERVQPVGDLLRDLGRRLVAADERRQPPQVAADLGVVGRQPERVQVGAEGADRILDLVLDQVGRVARDRELGRVILGHREQLALDLERVLPARRDARQAQDLVLRGLVLGLEREAAQVLVHRAGRIVHVALAHAGAQAQQLDALRGLGPRAGDARVDVEQAGPVFGALGEALQVAAAARAPRDRRAACRAGSRTRAPDRPASPRRSSEIFSAAASCSIASVARARAPS